MDHTHIMFVACRIALVFAFVFSPFYSARPATAQILAPVEKTLLAAGQLTGGESEPNDGPATASPISSGATIRGNIWPAADVDYYWFSAQAGDRVYAAPMTSFSPGNNDAQLTLLASDGTTVIEFDEYDGTFASNSASIAGAVIPSDGTYYLKVSDFSATNLERPYELHLTVQHGAPSPEVEPNDLQGMTTPLAGSSWVTGTHFLANDQDWYSLALAAGDTVFLSLDLDPERDSVRWNGRVGLGSFGDANNLVLYADDSGAIDTKPSEALFMTVKNAGTYYLVVDSASSTAGGATETYNLSVDIKPAADEGVSCTTYTSTDIPKTIGPAAGLISSTITIPGHSIIADLDVSVNISHTRMTDVDVLLRSPQGSNNGVFTDVGAILINTQRQMDTTFDDEAGIPYAGFNSFTTLKGQVLKPEKEYRLNWFDGEDAGGVWTLDVRDDATNTYGGKLNGWSLRVCQPTPPPTCPAGYSLNTIFSTDFEADDAGFTHTGTLDEWALGLPNQPATSDAYPLAAFTSCNSGSSCWKTDLTGGYEGSSNQDLLSPNISLADVTAPILVSWAQRYQMDDARLDHAFIDMQQVGGATPVRLWEWIGPTMYTTAGNPQASIGASGGWSVHTAQADSLAGLNSELRFHLDSDSVINLGGLAIDDVRVQGCVRVNAAPVANAGSDRHVYAGSSVQLNGSASQDPDNDLPIRYGWVQTGGPGVTLSSASVVSPTFTAPGTPGQLTFALVVTDSLGLVSLPDTVVITIDPAADLSISKMDAPDPVDLGQTLVYTLSVTNHGPSRAINVVLTDTLPAGAGLVSAPGCNLAGGKVICAVGAWGASLSGSSEVPPTLSGGGGVLSFTYEAATRRLHYSGTASGLSGGVTAAHLHQGAPGANGPAFASLVYVAGTNSAIFDGAVTLTPEQAVDLLAQGVYANVHTTAYPEGEVRGQVQPGLAAGQTVGLTLTVLPAAPGSLTNSAVVGSSTYDPQLGNNSASVTTGVNVPDFWFILYLPLVIK